MDMFSGMQNYGCFLHCWCLHPEIAKVHVEYRYERLDAARKKCILQMDIKEPCSLGKCGDGVEETPVWALSGPFEHHITACVGIGCLELLLCHAG